jgi:hypothetical protein
MVVWERSELAKKQWTGAKPINNSSASSIIWEHEKKGKKTSSIFVVSVMIIFLQFLWKSFQDRKPALHW